MIPYIRRHAIRLAFPYNGGDDTNKVIRDILDFGISKKLELDVVRLAFGRLHVENHHAFVTVEPGQILLINPDTTPDLMFEVVGPTVFEQEWEVMPQARALSDEDREQQRAKAGGITRI